MDGQIIRLQPIPMYIYLCLRLHYSTSFPCYTIALFRRLKLAEWAQWEFLLRYLLCIKAYPSELVRPFICHTTYSALKQVVDENVSRFDPIPMKYLEP